jgi:hypothetical protein
MNKMRLPVVLLNLCLCDKQFLNSEEEHTPSRQQLQPRAVRVQNYEWIRIGYAWIRMRMSLFTAFYFEFGYEYEYYRIRIQNGYFEFGLES